MVTQNDFGLKKYKTYWEAVSEDEEAAATFPVELRKLIRVSYSLRFQASAGVLITYPSQIKGDYFI